LQLASVAENRVAVSGCKREPVGESPPRLSISAPSEPLGVRRTLGICGFVGGDLLERSQERRRQIVRPLVERHLVGQVERGRVGALQSQRVALGGSHERGNYVVVRAALILEGQCQCDEFVGLVRVPILVDFWSRCPLR